jgi:transcription-repair coupling factor (superfamily II helicase)
VDYYPADALGLVDDWDLLEAELGELTRRAEQIRAERDNVDGIPPGYQSPVWDWPVLETTLRSRAAVGLGGLVDGTGASDLQGAFIPGPRYGGQVKPMLEHLVHLHLEGERVILVSRQAARLADLWSDHGPASTPREDLPDLPEHGTVTFIQGTLSDGFELRGRMAAEPGQPGAPGVRSLVHLLTDGEIFGWSRPDPRQAPRPKAVAPETHYADIAAGDLVVHIDHGIGRYEGLVTRTVGRTSHEYLLVTYAESDQLYVPIHQADRLSRYIGADESQPTLHRLGGVSWTQAKAKAQEAVAEIADELLALYAARSSVRGHAFSADGAWQAELEASFPYVETEDQLRVINQVKADMERPRPMDRLVCGDVGYGKTEVALRAAFKAVMDGKQVGVLVPTTVLAQQHYNNFVQRLATFPVEIQMLSRFRSREQQASILRDLKAGKVDIVIGTHRLLQKDVVFDDLGLLVVDEEQRFGVAHKEMLKKLRTEVDVLTMTATPIPRTLYLSLTGIRDISLITTPPEERLPVQTHVGLYDPELVRRSILREIDRRGQVFFVHNRVETIRNVAQHLRRLVPEARIAVGHGQMADYELERVMLSFVAGEVDVLVSTSIIENGLDIPNANTIIVDRAELFGLAQLYQLRGRVGRGARRAFAHVFYRNAAHLSAEARARLETLAEHTELGAGYNIAMRDLEIRGAGEILGTQQHGQIAAIGFDLYTRMLARAVMQQRDQLDPAMLKAVQDEASLELLPDTISIELPLDSYIPEDYIPQPQFRFRLYRRMAGLATLGAIDEMAAELADRFGPIPDPVDNLLYQLRVRLLAGKAGALSVVTVDGQIAIRRSGLEQANRMALQRFLGNAIRVSKHAIWMRRDQEGQLDWKVALVQTLERLAEWRG